MSKLISEALELTRIDTKMCAEGRNGEMKLSARWHNEAECARAPEGDHSMGGTMSATAQ